MTFKIGYWNINKKNYEEISSFLIDLIKTKDLDFLFLSEFENLIDYFKQECLPNTYSIVEHGPVCKHVFAIMRNGLDFKVETEDKRFMVLVSNQYKMTIVGLHLPSDLMDKKADRSRYNQLSRILEASKRINNNKNIYVGDFNCMPYADELTDINGMHAVLFKEEAKTHAGGAEKHYNPILLLLNEDNKLYGSFKYNSGACPLYWYAYDQVIVSESLIDSIVNVDYVKIINGNNLMSKRDKKPIISDHLPLFFEIKL